MTTEAKETRKPVTPMDGQKEWGPYLNYEYITTPHGLYGLPAGQIMWFEDEEVYNHKTHQNEILPMPHYKEVLIDDPRTLPVKDARAAGAKK